MTAHVENTNLGSAIIAMQADLAQLILPPGAAWFGSYANQQHAFRNSALVLGAALATMFLVLLWGVWAAAPALAILLALGHARPARFALLNLTRLTLQYLVFHGNRDTGIVAKTGILLLNHAEHATVADRTGALLNAARVVLGRP